MIDINKEAEEYSKSSLLNRKAAKHFIAGYNSKAKQAKVLQAQIDVLRYIQGNSITPYNVMIENKIKELQQRLKKLENGNKI
jgi:hypothetical protein